jgi:histidyl-tRNA synthetase
MRHADALGARYAAILGERELAENSVTLKDLANGSQETLPIENVSTRVLDH